MLQKVGHATQRLNASVPGHCLQFTVQTVDASYADGWLLEHDDLEPSVREHALLLIRDADSR